MTTTPASIDSCKIIEKYRFAIHRGNGSVSLSALLDFGEEFRGMPQCFFLSIALSILAILFFAYSRKRFWDYGRIAVHRESSIYTKLASSYDCVEHAELGYSGEHLTRTDRLHMDEDEGLFTWMYLWDILTDEDMLKKCGPAALQYLQFQRVLINYMSVVTMICLLFILPLNMGGTIHKYPDLFAMTTIGNLDPKDSDLFVHIIIAVGFFSYIMYSLRWFARSAHVPLLKSQCPNPDVGKAHQVNSTIMISHLPKKLGERPDLITRFFKEAYNAKPTVIKFAYDVRKLMAHAQSITEAEVAFHEAEKLREDEMITVHNCCLLNLFCRCKCFKKTQAKLFYKNLLDKLKKERPSVLKDAVSKPLPICFVTFQDKQDADNIASDFRRYFKFLPFFVHRTALTRTSLDSVLHPHKWKVSHAPKPTDIVWENLSVVNKTWLSICLNVAVSLLLFFLSTPSIFMNLYFKTFQTSGTGNDTASFEENYKSIAGNMILGQAVPAVIHSTFASVLPWLIYLVETYSYHETRSQKDLHLMLKSFGFLICMMLIMPSFGLVSGHFLIDEFLGKEDKDFNRWRCIFVPDNPAFFVNFLITITCFGVVMELVRPGHIFYYVCRILCARSRIELENAKSMSIFPFSYGANYAYMLTIFAITMAYCVVCPLIAPIGFIYEYFNLKSSIDTYNMYFAYDANYVAPEMHQRASYMVVFSVIFAQATLIGYAILLRGAASLSYDDPTTLVQAVVLLISFIVCVGLFVCYVYLGWLNEWTSLEPFRYGTAEVDESSPSSADSSHDDTQSGKRNVPMECIKIR